MPEYPHVLVVDGWTVSAQQVLPGASVRNPSPVMVEQVVECVAAMAGVACQLSPPDLLPWGASVVHTLTVGLDGWAMHEPLRTGGRRSAAVLDRVEAVGADADPAWFPSDGLVHLDLHTDNILAGDEGTLTGIIDWEGACAGDPRFDLVRFAYDLDGHDQPVWDIVEATGIEPWVLRAIRRPPRAPVHVLADLPPDRRRAASARPCRARPRSIRGLGSRPPRSDIPSLPVLNAETRAIGMGPVTGGSNMSSPAAKHARTEDGRARSLFGLEDEDRRAALKWVGENLPHARQSALGQHFLHRALGIAFVIGLVSYVDGYALKSSATTEPIGLVADLLYTLGYTLWTGVVVVLFFEVIPEIKRRQFKVALDAYEAAQRDVSMRNDARKEPAMDADDAAHETRGVKVDLLSTIDLGSEIEGMEGFAFRMRMVTIEPGGVFGPLHDHKGRPGLVYILRGTITDHRDGAAKEYGPGLGWPEDKDTAHWLENRGTTPAVEISVDIVRHE